MRQRNGFNSEKTVAEGNKFPNLIEYEEKYSIPTDGGAPVGSDKLSGMGGAYGSAVQPSMPLSGGAAPYQPYSAQQPMSAPAFDNYTAQYAPDKFGAATSERPMVFALRRYPDTYVYEYSDRLEYYRRTINGMEFVNTEYKRR